MRFRPCIDLHDGQVKQIVGGSLRDHGEGPVTNFVATRPPEYFADLYWRDGLEGGHVIKLGAGNDDAARAALSCHPGSLQLGGGITDDNAAAWLEAGAGKVIVTSHLFVEGQLSEARLQTLVDIVGRDRLVLDLSCRRQQDDYYVVCDRWQTFTSLRITCDTLRRLAESCAEFLIHGVDVEGKQAGIEESLVQMLGEWAPVPTTYAGGIATPEDVARIVELGQGRLGITVGSALDIFGGSGLRYLDLVAMDRQGRAGAPKPAWEPDPDEKPWASRLQALGIGLSVRQADRPRQRSTGSLVGRLGKVRFPATAVPHGGIEDMLEHPKHCVYTARHLWAAVDEKSGMATIGMTEELVEMLAKIQTLDMPMVGDELDMDTYCIHLHLRTRIHHLRSPLSGRVVEINRDVLDNPGLLSISAYGNFLYRMEFDEPGEIEVLMSAVQYGKYLDRL